MDGNEFSVDEKSQVAARKSSNLAFAFFCMSADRARDMEVFYAYCRILDDIADEEGRSAEEKIAALNEWKEQIEFIYSGKKANLTKMAEEVRDVVMRRDIPKQYMLDIIDGVMRDTDPAPFETVADIHRYCYGVACAVGLASIYIFGFKNEKTKDFAHALGYAFQFTNILRDVVHDWKTMGRVYIPQSELDAFGVSPEDFGKGKLPENCKELFRMMHFRAKHYFNRARRLLQPEDAAALTPAFIMAAIYERILDEIFERDFEISENIVKISKPKKIALALGALKRAKRLSKPAPENFGRAAVIGGGIAGIASAVNLSLKGYEVDLFEAKAHVGGRMSAMDWKRADLRIDNASHALMASCENFFALLETLGVGKSESFRAIERMRFLSKDGAGFEYRFPLKRDGISKFFRKIFELPHVEGFKKFANLFFLAKLKFGFAKTLENETVSEYLERQGVGEVATRLLWEPFCVSVQNTRTNIADAAMFRTSILETLLRGAEKSALMVNKTPLADILWPRAKYYIEACMGSVSLSSPVKDLEIEDGFIRAFSAGGGRKSGYDFCVFALHHKSLAALIPDGAFKSRIEAIKDSPILNVYFTTPKKLFDAEFVGLSDSSLHWIFDRTESDGGPYVYSVTVSAFEGEFLPQRILEFVKAELCQYFGEFEIVEFLPTLFKEATILSTPQNEALRPQVLGNFKNAATVGDWTGHSLPATIENAAKSAAFKEI